MAGLCGAGLWSKAVEQGLRNRAVRSGAVERGCGAGLWSSQCRGARMPGWSGAVELLQGCGVAAGPWSRVMEQGALCGTGLWSSKGSAARHPVWGGSGDQLGL